VQVPGVLAEGELVEASISQVRFSSGAFLATCFSRFRFRQICVSPVYYFFPLQAVSPNFVLTRFRFLQFVFYRLTSGFSRFIFTSLFLFPCKRFLQVLVVPFCFFPLQVVSPDFGSSRDFPIESVFGYFFHVEGGLFYSPLTVVGACWGGYRVWGGWTMCGLGMTAHMRV
jgi:hypothetical protein